MKNCARAGRLMGNVSVKSFEHESSNSWQTDDDWGDCCVERSDSSIDYEKSRARNGKQVTHHNGNKSSLDWRDLANIHPPTNMAGVVKCSQAMKSRENATEYADTLPIRKHQTQQKQMSVVSQADFHLDKRNADGALNSSSPFVPGTLERLAITPPIVVFPSNAEELQRKSEEKPNKVKTKCSDDDKIQFKQKVACRTFPEAPLPSHGHRETNASKIDKKIQHKKHEKTRKRYKRRQNDSCWDERVSKCVGRHVNKVSRRRCSICDGVRCCSMCGSNSGRSVSYSRSPRQSHFISERTKNYHHTNVFTVWSNDDDASTHLVKKQELVTDSIRKELERLGRMLVDRVDAARLTNDGTCKPKISVRDISLADLKQMTKSEENAFTKQARYQKWITPDAAIRLHALSTETLNTIIDWRLQTEQKQSDAAFYDLTAQSRVNTPRLASDNAVDNKAQSMQSSEAHHSAPIVPASTTVAKRDDCSTIHCGALNHSSSGDRVASPAKTESENVKAYADEKHEIRSNIDVEYNNGEERVHNRDFTTVALSVNPAPPTAVQKFSLPLRLSQVSPNPYVESTASSVRASVVRLPLVDTHSVPHPSNNTGMSASVPARKSRKTGAASSYAPPALRQPSPKLKSFRCSSVISTLNRSSSPMPQLNNKDLLYKRRVASMSKPIQSTAIDRRYLSTDDKANNVAFDRLNSRESQRLQRHTSVPKSLSSRPPWDNDFGMVYKHASRKEGTMDDTSALSFCVPTGTASTNRTNAESSIRRSRCPESTLMQSPNLSRSCRNRVVRVRSPTSTRRNVAPPVRKQFVVGRAAEQAPIFLTSNHSVASHDTKLISIATNVSGRRGPVMTRLLPVEAQKSPKKLKINQKKELH